MSCCHHPPIAIIEFNLVLQIVRVPKNHAHEHWMAELKPAVAEPSIDEWWFNEDKWTVMMSMMNAGGQQIDLEMEDPDKDT